MATDGANPLSVSDEEYFDTPWEEPAEENEEKSAAGVRPLIESIVNRSSF